MSIWNITYNVQIYQQPDNQYAAMASTENMRGWYTGYGANPQQALQAVKNEVLNNHVAGYNVKFVVTATNHNNLTGLEEKVTKVLVLKEMCLAIESTKLDAEYVSGYNECLNNIKAMLR